MTNPGHVTRRRASLRVVEQVETPSDFLEYYRTVLLPAQRTARSLAYVCIGLSVIACALAATCALRGGWHPRAMAGLTAAGLSVAISVLVLVMLNRQRVMVALLERCARLVEDVERRQHLDR
jgi:hypothetical protein